VVVIDHLLNMRCTIERPTVTTSSVGSLNYTYAVVAAETPCLLQITGPRQEAVADREAGVLEGVAYFAIDTDVRVQDRLTDVKPFQGSATFNTLTFEVMGPPTDDCGYGAYTRVPVRSTRGGGGP
jgi:hypothetical protein